MLQNYCSNQSTFFKFKGLTEDTDSRYGKLTQYIKLYQEYVIV